MLKSFTVRVFVSVLAAAVLSIAITVFYGVRTISQGQEDDVRDRMLAEASLAARVYALNGGDAQALHEIFRGGGQKGYDANLRLTVIDAGGTVVFDSSKESDELDNHADRPEIISARETGSGYSVRDSGSLRTPYAYTAVRLDDGGILRLAVPLATIQYTIANRTEVFLWVAGFTIAVSLIIALLVSISLKNSFLPMIGIVEAIARGQLHRRIRRLPGREFVPLAEAVNSMAQSIEEQVRKYADKTAQLETVLNSMSDGVLVLGPRGHIRRCNKALERNFPAVADARGRQVVEVIPFPALQNAVDEMLFPQNREKTSHPVPPATTEGKETASAAETTDSVARVVEVHGNGVSSGVLSLHMGLPSGKVFAVLLSRPQQPDQRCGLVAVFHDVTDIMRLEQVRRDFVANVSHELRTPLTAICGYAETLTRVADVQRCQKFAEVILRNARGLENMIADLLSLARLEREGQVQPQQAVVVADCVEEALGVCAKSFQARDVRVVSEVPADCRVMAEETYLTQVFRNLLENASRYAEKGSTVTVSSQVNSSQVFFRVSNRGPVIPREDLERIFERFYSVERHRGQGTTGLGLAICRHILERFNGRIWAESPDANGLTSFVFTLERAPEGFQNEAKDKGAARTGKPSVTEPDDAVDEPVQSAAPAADAAPEAAADTAAGKDSGQAKS